jgi:hypothetical protein
LFTRVEIHTMRESIRRLDDPVRDPQGREYAVEVVGATRSDGSWVGRLEFRPLDGRGGSLRSDDETTQPNREDLEYWASGLEQVYLEGALERARPV